MSEFLHSGPESFENEQESDSGLAELAANGLSRVIDERGDSIGHDDDEYNEERPNDNDDDEGDYDDSYEEEDDDEYGEYDDEDYYSEYEEQHYGEERADFDEERLTLQEIPLPKEILERYSFIGELPHGVAVMGGVARSIAREIITGEREPIRDIDLVNITDEDGNSEVDYETLDALSRKYMPDDYTFGHGVGNDTMDHYFKSRDFTINQSLIMDGKLIISDLAYNDFQENIIRPTYFEHPYDGDEISSRLFLKALMMRSVVSQISDSIPLIEDMERPDYIGSFDTALFLNKAMSRGAETARVFTGDLADWDIISEEYAGRPVALAKALLEDVYAFEFRPSTDERFKDIAECDDMGGFFVPSSMLSYHASDPVIRRAIAEYEDGIGESINSGEERLSGYYTQAEYDDINRSGGYDDDYDDYA
ncbi:hypothetical protein IIY66_00325 [Candidatus Saccharibacteria bacterium]|nr:hypothetical protein [Candidatus Saccharibacteria bacterium]